MAICGCLALETVTASGTMNLVWSDEFNGSTIDATKWTFDTGSGGANPGWGNQELEYYTGRTNNAYVARWRPPPPGTARDHQRRVRRLLLHFRANENSGSVFDEVRAH